MNKNQVFGLILMMGFSVLVFVACGGDDLADAQNTTTTTNVTTGGGQCQNCGAGGGAGGHATTTTTTTTTTTNNDVAVACGQVACPEGFQCEAVDGGVGCMPQASACGQVSCPEGFQCEAVDSGVACVEKSGAGGAGGHTTTSTTTGTTTTTTNTNTTSSSSVDVDAGAADPCKNVVCAAGQHCTATNGAVSCVSDPAPVCDVKCPAGYLCVFQGQVKACVLDADAAVPPVCNLGCPAGYHCVVQGQNLTCALNGDAGAGGGGNTTTTTTTTVVGEIRIRLSTAFGKNIAPAVWSNDMQSFWPMVWNAALQVYETDKISKAVAPHRFFVKWPNINGCTWVWNNECYDSSFYGGYCHSVVGSTTAVDVASNTLVPVTVETEGSPAFTCRDVMAF